MQPGTVSGGENRTFIETARRAQIVAAAIDTIAEVGYARASFARIAQRLGISRGLISYHFAGKDDLIKQVVHEVVQQGIAYMRPRIVAHTTGPTMLRAYIESNLAYMGEHRKDLIAIVEIARAPDGRRIFYGDSDVDDAVRALEHLLAGFQKAGEFRPDFDPRVMAATIRAVIDAVPSRLVLNPELDIDSYAKEIATTFDLATRIETRHDP
jgi:TetR/AcrR family transcriptional regulator, fatty acid metabolism regulator protein